MSPIDVKTMYFGGAGSSGMVQRTFRRHCVHRFGGSITNPLETLNDGVPPIKRKKPVSVYVTEKISGGPVVSLPTVNKTKSTPGFSGCTVVA